jgi:hypothetical protein
MALNAAVTCVCGATYAAIHWLAMLGVVRLYEIRHTTGTMADGIGTTTTITYHRALGLASGPSAALTDLDGSCMKVAFFAGALWMVRLALRAADRRIGFLRGVGILVGLGFFVAAGAMHYTTEAAVRRHRRGRTDVAISFLCGILVAAYATLHMAMTRADHGIDRIGDHTALIPVTWSIASSALQFVVVTSGIALAVFQTVSWWSGQSARRSVPARRRHPSSQPS